MSYILDALRKSEHERQMAIGQSVSVTYPVEFKRNNKPWLISSLLILACLMSLALIWWMWSQTQAHLPPTMATETLPEFIVKSIDLTHENSQKTTHNPTRNLPSPASRQKIPNHAVTMQETKTGINTVTNADPLRDLPSLNIAGYIHEEKNGSIAMINNKLVHEGEEVSPGLRLVKILDDSAIFSYKGYVFSR
jgi:cytoskeletal protein RodZ